MSRLVSLKDLCGGGLAQLQHLFVRSCGSYICHAFTPQHWQQAAKMAAATQQTRGMLRNSTHSTFSKARNFHARANQLSRKLALTCNAQAEDVLLRSLSDAGEVAVLVVNGTHLVQEAMTRHKMAPTATAALGRTLLGAALLGAYRKEEEKIQIQFRGDGPLGGILAVADTKGQVKGKVGNPEADPPLRPDGKLAVGAAVGQGQLCVTRSHPGQPRPYTGVVNITSGEVAEDLATYLAESEQTNSALALGVCIDRQLHVKSAGGYLVQVLPFCSDETLDQLESNLVGMPSMTQLLNQGLSPQQITDLILQGLGSSSSGETIVPTYGPCEAGALKDRMLRAVASLGEAEVRSILEEQGQVEVTCELCNEQFQFSEADVLQYV